MDVKSRCITNLEAAETAHKRSMDKLDLFLKDLSLDMIPPEERVPLNKTECAFGQWFYTKEELKLYLGPQLFEKIDALHTNWHIQYAEIYKVFFQEEEKKGLIKKLFRSNKQPSQLDIDKAHAYYDDLKTITAELLKQLSIAKRRLNAMSESKFVQ